MNISSLYYPEILNAFVIASCAALLAGFAAFLIIFKYVGLPVQASQSRNARTIVRCSWQMLLAGPHAIHCHIGHHLLTRMPFRALPIVPWQLAQQRSISDESNSTLIHYYVGLN